MPGKSPEELAVAVLVKELSSSKPRWLSRSEIAPYCLNELRRKGFSNGVKKVIPQLTLLNLLTQRAVTGVQPRDVLRLGRLLCRAASTVQRFLQSPVVLLLPARAALIGTNPRLSVPMIEQFRDLANGKKWRNRIRANITVDLAIGRTYNDREVGELIAIASGAQSDQRSAASAQKRWRQRNRQLLKKILFERAIFAANDDESWDQMIIARLARQKNRG